MQQAAMFFRRADGMRTDGRLGVVSYFYYLCAPKPGTVV